MIIKKLKAVMEMRELERKVVSDEPIVEEASCDEESYYIEYDEEIH